MTTTPAEQLQMRNAQRVVFKPEPMKNIKITRADVGKVFLLRKGKDAGEIMSREAFLAIPVISIQAWVVVSEFDVNTW